MRNEIVIFRKNVWSNANGQTPMSLCVQRWLLSSNEIQFVFYITFLQYSVNCAISCLFGKYITTGGWREMFFKRSYTTAITTQLPETLACTAPDTCVSGRSVWRNILWGFFCLPISRRWVPRLQNKRHQSITYYRNATVFDSFRNRLSLMYPQIIHLFFYFFGGITLLSVLDLKF